MVFARSRITLPKVNRFGWNLEQYIVGSWSWQILGAILSLSTENWRARRNFFVRWATHDFADFRRPIFTKFEHNTSIGVATKTFGAEFWKFSRKGSFSPKNAKHFFNVLRLQAAMTPQWLQIDGNSLPNDPCAECLVSIFRRPFVKRYALCYQLSVLSVCHVCGVCVLWSNGWIDQDETNWHGGRPRSRPHCVRWRPSSSSQKGRNRPQPFGHNRYGPKIGGLRPPFGEGGAGSPANTMSLGLRPTPLPSGNVTDR